MHIKTFRIAYLHGVFLSLLFLSHLSEARVEKVLGLPVEKNINLPGSMPSTPLSEIILSRDQYVISYNKDRRSPNWAAWYVDASDIGSSGRSEEFTIDTELDQYLSSQSAKAMHAVKPEDYHGSCMDRGHQVPSGDRTNAPANNKWTFKMSNMIPQTAYLNRVIWNHLEAYTRELIEKENKKVYIIAGPIYDQNFGAIGPQKDIPIPSKDFKLIIVLDKNQTLKDMNRATQMIAVVMPNLDQNGAAPSLVNTDVCPELQTNTAPLDDWKRYVTTVDEIEKLSGLKLFSSFTSALRAN